MKYKEKIGCSCQQCKRSKSSRRSAHKQAQRRIRKQARYILKRLESPEEIGKIIEGYGFPG